jgi:tetratricopeptide (TPR) repeat protein
VSPAEAVQVPASEPLLEHEIALVPEPSTAAVQDDAETSPLIVASQSTAEPAVVAPEAVPAEETIAVPTASAAHSFVDEEEARARYELAVAYKHMGLFDEAMEEFRQTITVKFLFLDTCRMMADCLNEQGAAQAAIAQYEQALTAARDDPERTTEIRYELGMLYEGEGLLDKAVEMYSSIPSHQDVEERLERIKAGQLTAPEPDAVLSGAGERAPAPRKKRRVSYL